MNWKLIRIIDEFIGIPLIWLLRGLAVFRHRSSVASKDADVRRILLIKFWGIGNVFMILPSIQALRSAYPAAAFDFLTLFINREALTMTGAVDEIITLDTDTPGAFIRTWRDAASLLRRNRYDMIIDFEQFARFSALMTYQVGAPKTIGFDTLGQHRHHLYSNPVAYDNDIHITRSFYALALEAGAAAPFSTDLQIASIEMLRETGARLLSSLKIPPDAPVVVMHAGTSDNFSERRWLPERYAGLADLLAERYGMRVVLTGLPDEAYLILETMRHLKSAANVFDMGGKLSFTEYFSLIIVADLVVSADTAAVHLASSVDIPVAGLYGPNTPILYGPWGKNGIALYAGFQCSPCITNFNSKINTCRHPAGRGACMQAITVEQVFEEIVRTYCVEHAPFRLKKLEVFSK